MAATIAQIRQGFADTISVTLTGTSWQVSAYMLASPTPPSIDVFSAGIDFDTAMGRGNDDMHFVVRAMVPFVADIGGQTLLDTLVDPTTPATSLKAIIEADKTLGGKVSSLQVETVSETKLYDVPGGTPALGCEWTVLVYP